MLLKKIIKNKKIILAMLIFGVAFLFSLNIARAQDGGIDYYSALEKTSDWIDIGINIAGEKSGEALGLVSNFFNSAGNFFNNISLRIACLFGQLPETIRQAGDFSCSFMQQYGWAFLAVLILLIFGYLLFKLLQISFFRNFIIRAIAGVLIIVILATLVIWGIQKLPPLPDMPDVKEYTEKTSQLLNDIDNEFLQNDEVEKNQQQDEVVVQEETNNYFVSAIEKVKHAYGSASDLIKGYIDDMFSVSQEFVYENKEKYADLLKPVESTDVIVTDVYIEVVESGLKITWDLSEIDKNLIKFFSIDRSIDKSSFVNIVDNLPANYYYYIDSTVLSTGLYTYQVTASLADGRKLVLNNQSELSAGVRADCKNKQCLFSFLNSDRKVEFSEDVFDVANIQAKTADKNNIIINIEKKSLNKEMQDMAYNSPEPLSIIGNNYFSVSAFNSKTSAQVSNFNVSPITLSFDISEISINDRKNLAVAWLNSDSQQWEIVIGEKLVGDFVEVKVNHLSDFALVDRLPIGQILNAEIICKEQRPVLKIEAWSYDPDYLSGGVPDVHIYDKDFSQTDFKFLFTNKNYQAYEAGHKVALKDMSLIRPNRPEPYTPVAGVNYGFISEKVLPVDYKKGDVVDVNAYALNMDGYGNIVKRSSKLSERRSGGFILTVPDCELPYEEPQGDIKPIGQILEAEIVCQGENVILTAKGWSYDPNNLALGVPPVHFYNKNFNQENFKFLFQNKSMEPYDRGHKVALKDMSLTRSNRPKPYTPAEGAHYGFFSSAKLSGFSSGDIIDVNAYALNINNTGTRIQGNTLLNRPFPEKLSLQVPYCGHDENPDEKNWKNILSYFNKDAFLISSKNWQDILSLVPATVWTGQEDWCQRSAEADSDVCVYPVLIFYEDTNGFDADSIIHFFQQYKPNRITVIGATPQKLQDLLIADAPVGAGLPPTQVNYLSAQEIISRYWLSYRDVVYVENDYATAMIASTYASLINAPLVILGSDNSINFIKGKNIICIGNINMSLVGGEKCDEVYSTEQLEVLYAQKTSTDKIIFVNPDDLNTSVGGLLKPKKSGFFSGIIYGKNSLSAPILASAKHEIIISNTSQNYQEISDYIELKVKKLIPEVINNSDGMERNNFSDPIFKLYQSEISSVNGKEERVALLCGNAKTKLINGKSVRWDCQHIFIYDPSLGTTKDVQITKNVYGMDFSDKSAVYSFYNQNSKKCELYQHDFASSNVINFFTYDGFCKEVRMSKDYIVWAQDGSGYCYGTGQACDSSCSQNVCLVGKNLCSEGCASGDLCMPDICLHYTTDLHVVDALTKHTLRIFPVENLRSFDLYENNLVWTYNNINNKKELTLYRINSGRSEIFLEEGSFSFATASKDKVLWTKGDVLYSYDINNDDIQPIASNLSWNVATSRPAVSGNILTLLRYDGEEKNYCEKSGQLCAIDNKCPAICKDGECETDACLPSNVYSYDLSTGIEKQIYSRPFINFPVSDGLNLMYSAVEKSTFYIDGYLTIIGSPYAVPYREYMGATTGYIDQNYRALDITDYADIYLNDRYPDMAVGRIQGISTSDVSGYLARDLFHSNIDKNNAVFSYLREGFGPPAKLNEWSKIFAQAGYEAFCAMDNISGADLSYCKKTPEVQWGAMWEDKDFIYYDDHGDVDWAGIKYSSIPELNNPLVVMAACLTCSTAYSNSFCNNIIRRGALGFIGAVSVAYSNNIIYDDTINAVFFEGLDVGKSFARSFIYNNLRYMTTYIGDPTLNIKPSHYLLKPLPN